MTEHDLMFDLVDDDDHGADILMIDDYDDADETELRRIVRGVEGVVGCPRTVRLSVLGAEHWQLVLARALTPRLRNSVAPHLHVLRDPRDARHLYVSRTAVVGINEGSALLSAEVMYAICAMLGEPLPRMWARGAADLICELGADDLGLSIFTHNYPEESEYVRAVIAALQAEYGFELRDWIAQLKTRPTRFFLGLRRSAVITNAVASGKTRRDVKPLLDGQSNRRAVLIAALQEPTIHPNDPIAKLVRREAQLILKEST